MLEQTSVLRLFAHDSCDDINNGFDNRDVLFLVESSYVVDLANAAVA